MRKSSDFLQVQPSQPRIPKFLVPPQEDAKLTVCSQDAFAGCTSPELRVSCAQGPGLAVSGTSPEHRATPGAATFSGSLPPRQPHPPEGCVSPRRAPYLMAHLCEERFGQRNPPGKPILWDSRAPTPHLTPIFSQSPPSPETSRAQPLSSHGEVPDPTGWPGWVLPPPQPPAPLPSPIASACPLALGAGTQGEAR